MIFKSPLFTLLSRPPSSSFLLLLFPCLLKSSNIVPRKSEEEKKYNNENGHLCEEREAAAPIKEKGGKKHWKAPLMGEPLKNGQYAKEGKTPAKVISPSFSPCFCFPWKT